jgi:hypothetical protein
MRRGLPLVLVICLLALGFAPAARADEPTKVHLVQAIWPLRSNASEQDVDAAQHAADALAEGAHGCDDFRRTLPSTFTFRDFGWISLDGMPPEARAIAVNQELGVPTMGIRGDGGMMVFVVCGRRSVGITPKENTLLIPTSVVIPKLGFGIHEFLFTYTQ